MDEEKLQNQISNVVRGSPAVAQQEAEQPIEAPAHATLRVGTSDQIQEAPAAQYTTTPEQGIGFTDDTDEIIRAGTAIPGFNYDTRFKTAEDRGDPLYFEPNFQPVVPYPVGNYEATTVNKNKLAWNIAMTNYAAWDKDYIGYYRLPEPGSQSWWDFLVGGTMTNVEALPATAAKGATGAITSVGKGAVVGAALQNSIWKGVLGKIMSDSPLSDAGSLFNAIAQNYNDSGANAVVDELNNLQKIVADAVSPLEQHAFETWDADVTDNSFKAKSARGVSSGLVSFGLAIATKSPEIAFTLLNFANVADMRNKALDFGVSPGWAEAYSIGGGVLNSVLDMLQFEALINSASLVKQGTQEFLSKLSLSGLWNSVKKHAPRELAVAGAEAATEMFQSAVEEWYDPEFRKDPTDTLSIAAMSAFVLKAITLPASVRHAKFEEMARVAETAGVKDLFKQIVASGYAIVDKEIERGTVRPEDRNEMLRLMISEAPDMVIRTVREGPKGELDKIPADERKQMLSVLNDIKNNFVGDPFSPKTFAKLDAEVDTSLAGIRNGITDAEVEMIKGLVRGAYVNAAIANRNNPNYQGFQVPTFKFGNTYYRGRPSSVFDDKTNTVEIHRKRSDTEFSNNSPSYTKRLDPSFVPASRQSDRMASIIHEMAHWMDAMVGEQGFGDFLEHYYNSIATAFGNDRALRLYNEREGKGKERPKEYFAQTMGRMGKRAAEAFGLGKSQANRFLSYANIAMNQLGNLEGKAGEKLSQNIADFQTALQQLTKANMDKLSDLIKVYGQDNIKQALENFNRDSEGYGDFAEYLANKDMLQELFNVMDGFADAAGIDKINDLFQGDQKAMDNFVTMGDKMFREGYDNAVEEVRKRRAEAKKTAPKPVEAQTDQNLALTALGLVDSSTTDSSQVHEEGVQYETGDEEKANTAKDSIKESFNAGKQEKKQIAADVKIDGRNLTDDITMAEQGLTQRLKQPMNKLVKWASSSPWGWGLDRILVTVLGREAAEKLDVAGKYAAKQNIRSGYWEQFMNRLKPLFGDPKTNTEFMYKYKTMTTNLGFVRMTGLETIDPVNEALSSARDITGWEAMYVYLMKEQGFGDRVQRTTTTNIDDIIATLSDEEKAVGLAMSDQLMSMYEKTFGKSKYEHYFPILSAEHELFDEVSIDSLTARQNTDDAIAIFDAGRIFSQYISRWASHESGYYPTMKRTRDIFRYKGVEQKETGPRYTFNPEEDEARMRASAQVAAATRQIIGEDGYRNLMNLIESELQEGQEQMFDASRNKTLTQVGNNIIRSILSNKMVSFPKNVANMFMFWGGAKDQSTYWNSFAEGLGNFRDTYKYMMEHSPEIKQRWASAGGINEYLDQRTLGGSTAPTMKAIAAAFAKMNWTGDKTQTMAKFSAVMEMLGDTGLKVFMQSGDMIANVYGGYGLVKDYMAQGMSEAEAFKKLDRYIIEHQSSSNLAMKPLVQKLQNKSLLGQVFAFTSEGVAKWASILGTFDEVKMGTATKSEAIANVVSIAISMALYSLVAAGAWDLLDDDEKVQEETLKALGNTLFDQVFGGMVAGNAFITPALAYLVGDSRVSGMSVPIYNFALDGISALKKGEYDRVLTKAMSAFGVPVGADNVWSTLLGVSLLTDPDPDVRYAGKLMMAGYTPSRAAKRAGIKKEKLEKNDEE